MNGSRAASRAWSGLVKDTLVRDGATTVEAVPMTLTRQDEHVVTKHGDDFIAISKAWTWRQTSSQRRWENRSKLY